MRGPGAGKPAPQKARPAGLVRARWRGVEGYLQVSRDFPTVGFRGEPGSLQEEPLAVMLPRLRELAPRTSLLGEAELWCGPCYDWHRLDAVCARPVVTQAAPAPLPRPPVGAAPRQAAHPLERPAPVPPAPAPAPSGPPPIAPQERSAEPNPAPAADFAVRPKGAAQALQLVPAAPEPGPPADPVPDELTAQVEVPSPAKRVGRPPTRPFGHLPPDSPERYKANIDAGTCPRCEKRPLAAGRNRCAECLDEARTTIGQKTAERVQAGRCGQCGQPIEREGAWRCNACLEKRGAAPANDVAPPPAENAAGTLPDCAKCYRPATHGTLCEHHAEKNRESGRRQRIKKGQAVDVLRCRNCGETGHNVLSCPHPVNENRCQKCSEPATHGKLCWTHRERAREKVNASYARLHPEAIPRTCAICADPGHNARACPERGQPPAAVPGVKSPSALIGHRFQLRPGMWLLFHLPADLDARDVERLSRWLHTLPPDDAAEAAPRKEP